MTTPTTAPAATKTFKAPAVSIRRLPNMDVNSCAFTVSLTPPGLAFAFDHRVLTLTQIGTTSRYRLTEERVTRNATFREETTLVDAKEITGKAIAWTVYKLARAMIMGEPHAYVVAEIVRTRPVGITDPKDRRYCQCNLRLVGQTGGHRGNCFYVYDSVYVRCDDKPLTATDLEALRNNAAGQVHRVEGQPGGWEARVHSEIDSGD